MDDSHVALTLSAGFLKNKHEFREAKQKSFRVMRRKPFWPGVAVYRQCFPATWRI
jgi:hypothetical protein